MIRRIIFLIITFVLGYLACYFGLLDKLIDVIKGI